MKPIRIVSHCYADKYVHFAWALKLQAMSLLQFPCECEVRWTVCWTESDENTSWVMDWAAERFRKLDRPLFIDHIPLPKEWLWRRAIGRHRATLFGRDGLLWFTDCDYLFGEDCLSTLARMEWPEGASVAFPSKVLISETHEQGDQLLCQAWHVDKLPLDEFTFVPHYYSKAIGGVQIVRAEDAWHRGYVEQGKGKWHRPVKQPFPNFRDDIVFRQEWSRYGRIVPITLPNLYRVRHTKTSYQEDKT